MTSGKERDYAAMSREQEDAKFRFDLLDAIVLMLVASLLSLANARVRVEPMRFEENGSVRMVFDRTHEIGWPAPVRRWTPGGEIEGWLPGGVLVDVLFAVLVGALALFARRTIVRLFVAATKRRSSAAER